MTTPEQNAANDQDAQELTDENLDEVSGGKFPAPFYQGETDIPTEKIGNNSFGIIFW
jgi:hypothetical protein